MPLVWHEPLQAPGADEQANEYYLHCRCLSRASALWDIADLIACWPRQSNVSASSSAWSKIAATPPHALHKAQANAFRSATVHHQSRRAARCEAGGDAVGLRPAKNSASVQTLVQEGLEFPLTNSPKAARRIRKVCRS